MRQLHCHSAVGDIAVLWTALYNKELASSGGIRDPLVCSALVCNFSGSPINVADLYVFAGTNWENLVP